MKASAFGAQSFHDMRFVADLAGQPAGPKVGDTTVVERWNGKAWEQWELVWDGERYVRQPEQPSVHKQAYDA